MRRRGSTPRRSGFGGSTPGSSGFSPWLVVCALLGSIAARVVNERLPTIRYSQVAEPLTASGRAPSHNLIHIGRPRNLDRGQAVGIPSNPGRLSCREPPGTYRPYALGHVRGARGPRRETAHAARWRHDGWRRPCPATRQTGQRHRRPHAVRQHQVDVYLARARQTGCVSVKIDGDGARQPPLVAIRKNWRSERVPREHEDGARLLTRIIREGADSGETQEPPCGTNAVLTNV